jgi:NTE family protein
LATKAYSPKLKEWRAPLPGANTDLLVCLGYTAEETGDITYRRNFKSFEDGWDPLRLTTRYGWYKGDVFLNLFNVKQFSYAGTPDVIVAEAVRASLSIPLFFKAWKFTNGIPDDHIYVDGGVVLNYPLTAFDTVTRPDDPKTLGFYLHDFNGCKAPGPLTYDEPIAYFKALFEIMLEAQDINFDLDPCMKKRTVLINDFGILATDFAITKEDKDRLYDSGVKYTSRYLSNLRSQMPLTV